MKDLSRTSICLNIIVKTIVSVGTKDNKQHIYKRNKISAFRAKALPRILLKFTGAPFANACFLDKCDGKACSNYVLRAF